MHFFVDAVALPYFIAMTVSIELYGDICLPVVDVAHAEISPVFVNFFLADCTQKV